MRSGVTLRPKRSEKMLHLSTGYVTEDYSIVCTVNNAGKARRKERKMADKFFTQTTCDRCGGSLAGGRTMSMLSGIPDNIDYQDSLIITICISYWIISRMK